MKKIMKLILIGIIAFGCKKDPIETDPAKAILGKWECIASGNGSSMIPISPAKGYEEYLPDSVMYDYDYETQTQKSYKYHVDSLLHFYQYSGGIVFDNKFKLTFSDHNNTMNLELQQPFATFHNFIYKRIN
jgi:hypothetical protein